MQCINCGRELPPDTARCPYCIRSDEEKAERKTERRKIYYTLGFCALILTLVTAAVLIFMPRSSFRRDMENAENCYSVAALCESSPAEAGESRYQLILMDAADEIAERYDALTSGYNQTVTALRQLYLADNLVVRDHVEDIWADVERRRFIQLLNHKRTENGAGELVWDDDITSAAESIADEYAAAGMDYQNNMKRLIQNLLPDIESISAFSVFSSINAQDAVVKYEEQSDAESSTDLIYGDGIALAGIDAMYDYSTGTWSFFILAQ